MVEPLTADFRLKTVAVFNDCGHSETPMGNFVALFLARARLGKTANYNIGSTSEGPIHSRSSWPHRSIRLGRLIAEASSVSQGCPFGPVSPSIKFVEVMLNT